MQIILLEKIEKLGNLGDQINVKSGYARNFLIPKGIAVLATKKNIEYFEERRADLEIHLTQMLIESKAIAEKINAIGEITIVAKAGDGGKLFGSIGTRDIANALISAGIKIPKSKVRLSNGVLRTIGKHEIKFHIYNGITARVIANIVSK